MTAKGELTDLLLAKPVDIKKVIRYAVTTRLGRDTLLALSYSYSKITEKVRSQISIISAASCICKPNVIEILLHEGWHVNGVVGEAEPPLWNALTCGNIPVAKLLIQKGAEINCMRHGRTLMAAALTISNEIIVGKGEIACVEGAKLLINEGISVNAIICKEDQNTAIHEAAFNNYPNLLNFLIQNGADVNAKNAEGSTALDMSSINNGIKCIKILMKHNKLDLYVQNIYGDTALNSAVRKSSKQAVKTLVREGFNVNQLSNDSTCSPLILAVGLLNLEMVSILLDLGADPNLQVNSYTSPLFIVASPITYKNGIQDDKTKQLRYDVAQLLIERGGNINIDHVYSPLHKAIREGYYELAKLFIRSGADVNFRNNISHCTLFHFVVGLNCDLIELFLEYGGDYNSLNKIKETPYNLAISHWIDLKFIKCFIQFGCPYNQDSTGIKILSIEINWEVIRFFAAEQKFFQGIKDNDLNLVIAAVKEGAVVNGCSEEITYPIHFLAFHGYNEILHFLLERGVPPNMLNKKGESALHIAAKLGHYDCCCSLLKFGACYNYSYSIEEIQDKRVITLLQNVRKMFALASVGHKKVISILENLINNDIHKYFIYANAVNCRGDSLLASAVRKSHTNIVRELIHLRTRYNLQSPIMYA